MYPKNNFDKTIKMQMIFEGNHYFWKNNTFILSAIFYYI